MSQVLSVERCPGCGGSRTREEVGGWSLPDDVGLVADDEEGVEAHWGGG